MSDNRLKIEAGSLDLELTGDADYIIEAYEAIRTVAMQCFEETLHTQREDDSLDQTEEWKPAPKKKGTDPHFSVDGLRQQVAAGRELVKVRLKFVVCTEMYERVAALSRDDFRESIFGTVVNPDALARVYLSEPAAENLEDQLEFDETLWRKLTAAGKAAIRGESS